MSSASSRETLGGPAHQSNPAPQPPSPISLEPMSVTMTPSGLAAVIRSSPAQLSNPPGVVQIRQIRAQGNCGFKGLGPGTLSHAQAGSTLLTLNHRQVPQNLTILPGRPTVVTSNFTARGATLQLTGTGTRPVPVVTSGTPGSITVTPISGTSLMSGLRFTTSPGSPQVAGSGTWTTGPATLRPPTAIQVRPLRPEPGKIFLNQANVVQHVTQLQVVSSSPSSQIALKPSTSISIRGTIHPAVPGQGTSGPTPIPLAPFTIRAATIARPGLGTVVSMAPTSQVQKVITQPAHGPPIIVNNPNVGGTIQRGSGTISTNLQTRLPVAFTLAKGTTLTPTVTSSNPPTLVGLQHRNTTTTGGNIAMMSPSLPPGATAKLYPLSRDVSTSLVETFITQGHVQTSQSTISSPPTLNVRTSIGLPMSRTTTIVTGTPVKGTTSSTGVHGPIVQVGTINLPQSYILPQVRPLTLDHTKKINTGPGAPPGTSTTNLILTAAPTTVGQPITFPITPASGTHYAAHPISISKPLTGVSGAGSVLIAPPHLTISPHITLGPPQSPASALTSTSSGSGGVLITPTTSSVSTLTPTLIGSAPVPSGALAHSTPSTTNSTTSTPAASPKSNLSPRPSILRKRDALVLEPTPSSVPQASPLRAQRNLSLNFGNSSSNPPTVLISPANKENTTNPLSAFISTIVTSNTSTVHQPGTGSSSANQTIAVHGSHASTQPVPISLTTTTCPLTFLKANEPFLPPNEESDGSNSSSGSTTLSTTSETAGTDLIHLQDEQPSILPSPVLQPSLPQTTILVSRAGPMGTSNLPPVININTSHNGILIRSSVPNSYGNLSGTIVSSQAPHPHPPAPTISQQPARRTGGAGGRGSASGAGRRGGGGGDKDKSPRKKPRKQQLNVLGSSEVSFIPTKRYKKGAGSAGQAQSQQPTKPVVPAEDGRALDAIPLSVPTKEGRGSGLHVTAAPVPGSFIPTSVLTPHNIKRETVGRARTRASSYVSYNLTKPRVPLVLPSDLPTNTRYNHFERYSDVKSKDERRPTINDLANQRNVDQKISGWKLRHLSGQLEEVIGNESGVVNTFVELLGQMDSKFGAGGSLGGSNRDLSRIEDLLKGNIQRCRVIRDQMTESKAQVFKVLDHQPRVAEVIKKYMSRRGGTSNNTRSTGSSPPLSKPSLRNYDKY